MTTTKTTLEDLHTKAITFAGVTANIDDITATMAEIVAGTGNVAVVAGRVSGWPYGFVAIVGDGAEPERFVVIDPRDMAPGEWAHYGEIAVGRTPNGSVLVDTPTSTEKIAPLPWVTTVADVLDAIVSYETTANGAIDATYSVARRLAGTLS